MTTVAIDDKVTTSSKAISAEESNTTIVEMTTVAIDDKVTTSSKDISAEKRDSTTVEMTTVAIDDKVTTSSKAISAEESNTITVEMTTVAIDDKVTTSSKDISAEEKDTTTVEITTVAIDDKVATSSKDISPEERGTTTVEMTTVAIDDKGTTSSKDISGEKGDTTTVEITTVAIDDKVTTSSKDISAEERDTTTVEMTTVAIDDKVTTSSKAILAEEHDTTTVEMTTVAIDDKGTTSSKDISGEKGDTTTVEITTVAIDDKVTTSSKDISAEERDTTTVEMTTVAADVEASPPTKTISITMTAVVISVEANTSEEILPVTKDVKSTMPHLPSSATRAPITSSWQPTEKETMVCGKPVSDMKRDECYPNNHQAVKLESNKCDGNLQKTNEWIRFIDDQDKCRQIPMFQSSTCFQPESCDSDLPYYMTGTNLTPKDSVSQAEMCTTTVNKTGHAQCCDAKSQIYVDVINCGDRFFIYKFTSWMPPQICGKVCLTEFQGTVPIGNIVETGSRISPTFEELDNESKFNLVALIMKIINMAQYKKEWNKAKNKLTQAAEEALQNASNRQKRSDDSQNVQVQVLRGYPKVNEDDNVALYVFTMSYSNGKPVKKETAELAITSLKNKDIGHGLKFGSTTKLPEELVKTPLPSIDVTDEPKIQKDTPLWMAIVIIVGIVLFIIIFVLLFIGFYKVFWKRRSGTMNVLQLRDELIEEDELTDSYKMKGGRLNVAMLEEDDLMDSNQNGNHNGKSTNNELDLEMQQF
ncbi:zonadhesin-like [Watersipora subatra]|uniref:zonadhesin-like n=1 Tax=Watersipora subatra TaxID=2589382 RepID=UPI00355AE276